MARKNRNASNKLLPKELTTVTGTSKTLAVLLFLTLPVAAFIFGVRVEQMQEEIDTITNQTLNQHISTEPTRRNYMSPNPTSSMLKPQAVMCTQEAKLCPDGSYVGRTGPNCEFAACPKNK